MEKKNKIFKIFGIIFGVIIICLLIGMLTVRNQINELDEKSYNINTTGKQLAIISDDSHYKQNTIAGIAENIDNNIRIDVFGLQDTKKVKYDNYDVIFVMAPVYMGGLQNDAKKWISKADNKDNIILLITSGSNTHIDLGVDTITSATGDINIESIQLHQKDIKDIVNTILEKLQ